MLRNLLKNRRRNRRRLSATLPEHRDFRRRLLLEPLEDRLVLSGMVESYPKIPGMVLVDPRPGQFDGQIIYLDFDGAEDVTYNGPVTVGPFDVPAFEAPGELAGQEQELISLITAGTGELFEPLGVTVTHVFPGPSVSEYSTVYIGGTGDAFEDYGQFYGLAETVDVGNVEHQDDANVFSDEIARTYRSATEYSQAVAAVVVHEAGHLLGYQHVGDHHDGDGMLDSVAYGGDTHYEILASASSLYQSLFGINDITLEYEDYLSSWESDSPNDGGSLREGVVEEDDPASRCLDHFSNGGDGDELLDGLNLGGWQNTPYELASENHYPNAVNTSLSTSIRYWWLGRTMHLLQDSTVPAHVHKDEHGPELLDWFPGLQADSYESSAYGNRSYFTFTGTDYWSFQDWDGDWSSPQALWDRSDDYTSLELLFRETTDYADDYDSDDAWGDWHNAELGDYFPSIAGTPPNRTDSLARATRLSELDRSHHDDWANDNVTGNTGSALNSTELRYLARDLGTWAVEQSAMLLRYFYDDLDKVVATPSNMHIDGTSSTSIDLDWNHVSGKDGYVVYRSTSSDAGFTRVGSPSSSQFSDTGLSSETTYYYRVFAYNDVVGMGVYPVQPTRPPTRRRLAT